MYLHYLNIQRWQGASIPEHNGQKSGNLLTRNWSKFPPPLQLAKITRKFLQQERHLALRVPSTQSLTEFNYLLNPAHPDFGRFVRKIGLMEINFDPRLGGK